MSTKHAIHFLKQAAIELNGPDGEHALPLVCEALEKIWPDHAGAQRFYTMLERTYGIIDLYGRPVSHEGNSI